MSEEEGLQGVVVCSLDVKAPGKAQQAKSESAELPRAEDAGDMLDYTQNSGTAAGSDSTKLRPLMLVAAADMYSLEPKPASVAGGILTVLALMAAVAYTVSQVSSLSSKSSTCTGVCCSNTAIAFLQDNSHNHAAAAVHVLA
jgi:hypothetical protein